MELIGVTRQINLAVTGDSYLNVASYALPYIVRSATFANLSQPAVSATVRIYRRVGSLEYDVIAATSMVGWGPGTSQDFLDVAAADASKSRVLPTFTLYIEVANAEPSSCAVDLYLYGDVLK